MVVVRGREGGGPSGGVAHRHFRAVIQSLPKSTALLVIWAEQLQDMLRCCLHILITKLASLYFYVSACEG